MSTDKWGGVERPRPERHPDRTILDIKKRLLFAPRMEAWEVQDFWPAITREGAEFIASAAQDIEDLLRLLGEDLQ